jgi:hypothetical protein
MARRAREKRQGREVLASAHQKFCSPPTFM